MLRLGSARTGNEQSFRYLTVRPEPFDYRSGGALSKGERSLFTQSSAGEELFYLTGRRDRAMASELARLQEIVDRTEDTEGT